MFVFSLIRVSRFGDLEFVENIHQYSSRVVGRELSCKRVGPRIAIRPTNPPLTLAAPPFSPLGCCSRPFPSPFSWTPPLSHLLPPQTFAALTTQNPSRPPPISLPPLQGAALPRVLRRVAAISIGVWREEEGRRKGRT